MLRLSSLFVWFVRLKVVTFLKLFSKQFLSNKLDTDRMQMETMVELLGQEGLVANDFVHSNLGNFEVSEETNAIIQVANSCLVLSAKRDWVLNVCGFSRERI